MQDISDNVFERIGHLFTLFYHISDIFMISYLGNEIKLSSDHLSYCLFESDWMAQPESTKKRVVIFGEFLKKPHLLVIGKIYPLTLETFTRVGYTFHWIVYYFLIWIFVTDYELCLQHVQYFEKCCKIKVDWKFQFISTSPNATP